MKSIFIITPSFGVHGGIRVILEWANRLSTQYKVYLRPLKSTVCGWFPISHLVEVVTDDTALESCDLLIITSPHSIAYQAHPKPARKIIFLQMMEHLFRPMDPKWLHACLVTYKSELPMICLSHWGMEMMNKEFGRTAPTYWIGNGVNLDHFPVSTKVQKDEKYVLVEGWIPGNASKDTLRIGPEVASSLKSRGYKVLAYGTIPLTGPFSEVPDEYHLCPDLPTLNRLYEQATILIKASRYDFRSCSPMEAMTKGTVTARAIIAGDDDLVHGRNCLRSGYEKGPLLKNATSLLSDPILRNGLAKTCIHYVQDYTWEYWMERIDSILWKD